MTRRASCKCTIPSLNYLYARRCLPVKRGGEERVNEKRVRTRRVGGRRSVAILYVPFTVRNFSAMHHQPGPRSDERGGERERERERVCRLPCAPLNNRSIRDTVFRALDARSRFCRASLSGGKEIDAFLALSPSPIHLLERSAVAFDWWNYTLVISRFPSGRISLSLSLSHMGRGSDLKFKLLTFERNPLFREGVYLDWFNPSFLPQSRFYANTENYLNYM